jgi:ribosomal protein L10
MSKPVKNMIVKEYRKRFSGVEGAVLVEIRGLDAPATNKMRNDFARKNVKVAVVKNALAREALKGGALEPLGGHLSGPSISRVTWSSGPRASRSSSSRRPSSKAWSTKAPPASTS